MTVRSRWTSADASRPARPRQALTRGPRDSNAAAPEALENGSVTRTSSDRVEATVEDPAGGRHHETGARVDRRRLLLAGPARRLGSGEERGVDVERIDAGAGLVGPQGVGVRCRASRVDEHPTGGVGDRDLAAVLAGEPADQGVGLGPGPVRGGIPDERVVGLGVGVQRVLLLLVHRHGGRPHGGPGRGDHRDQGDDGAERGVDSAGTERLDRWPRQTRSRRRTPCGPGPGRASCAGWRRARRWFVATRSSSVPCT